jgi:hypothetical protein
MGRFMSPDWSTSPDPIPYADITNQQTLNLYSYAGNNPLSNIDADGHVYHICDQNGQNCSDVSDKDFDQIAKNARAAGESWSGGNIKLQDGSAEGSYKQTDVEGFSRVAFSQAAGNSRPETEVSICQVTSDAQNYDGKQITVRGLYRMVIHGAILMDRSCPKEETNLREAQGYKADRKASALIRSLTKKDQFQPVEAVFRGTFRVAHEGQCFGQICAEYEIETTELVTAHLAPLGNDSPAKKR